MSPVGIDTGWFMSYNTNDKIRVLTPVRRGYEKGSCEL